MSAAFLFMGVQEDPEFDVIEARGNVRIYDGTEPETKCSAEGCDRLDRHAGPHMTATEAVEKYAPGIRLFRGES